MAEQVKVIINNEMKDIDVSKCPAMRLFNVFGLPDKPCCYYEMEYCEDVGLCYYKKLMNKLEKIKELAITVYDDEDNDYQATGICWDILQIIGEDDKL